MSDLPDLVSLPGMRAALAQRDITEVYRLLKQAGVPQRVIAAATGQSQSEVSEILCGRQVQAYDGDSTEPAAEEVDEDVERRNFLAVASDRVRHGGFR